MVFAKLVLLGVMVLSFANQAKAEPLKPRTYVPLDEASDIMHRTKRVRPDDLLRRHRLSESRTSTEARIIRATGRTIASRHMRDYLPKNKGSALYRVLMIAGELTRWLGGDGVPYKQHPWVADSDRRNLRKGIDCSRSIWFAFTRARIPYNEADRYLSTYQMIADPSPMTEAFEPCELDDLKLGDVLVYRSRGRNASGHTVIVIDPAREIAWGSHGWDGSPFKDTGVELQTVVGGRGWRNWDSRRMRFVACWRHRAFKTYPFTVSVTPPDAEIRILNIRPRYRSELDLEGGWYELEVSREGCIHEQQWVWHDGDALKKIDLKCEAKSGTLLQDRLRDGQVGPRLVVLPAGRFRMGGTGEDEKPVHRVRITRAFALGQYEVTVEEFGAFCSEQEDIPCPPGELNQPATNVSWNDAHAYVQWLSGMTGARYRLPTEAEWEYAARAGTRGLTWWGEGPVSAICSDCQTSAPSGPAKVGSTKANPFGLFDMLGNVYEWVEDSYSPTAYQRHGRTDPRVEDGDPRVRRGGGWRYGLKYSRSAFRGSGPASERRDDVGFRVLREL